MLMNLQMPPGMGANGMPIGMNPEGGSGQSSNESPAEKAMAAGANAMKGISGATGTTGINGTSSVATKEDQEKLVLKLLNNLDPSLIPLFAQDM